MNTKTASRNYFEKHEVECKCGCGMVLDPDFHAYLNLMREEFGQPIIINSGARCEEYNRKVGGSPRSSHVLGRAVDIRLDHTVLLYRNRLAFMIRKYKLRRGKYDTFWHVDNLLGERQHFDMSTPTIQKRESEARRLANIAAVEAAEAAEREGR